MIVQHLLALILIFGKGSGAELSFEYLANLINETVEESLHYQYPKSNKAFEGKFVHIDYGTFDFIIVGAGSSGSVVASRLSEIKNWKILLIEAGAEDNDFTDIPALNRFTLVSKNNWGYNTTVQKHGCKGFADNRCPYPRGKILGGCSTINELIYSRGIKQDYDRWEKLGNPGWSYNDVLPYFKKMENFHITPADYGYHGYTGPVYVNYSTPSTPFQDIFIEGFKSLGYNYIDYTGKDDVGVSKLQSNIKYGKRVSGSSAYLRKTRKRSNFDIATDSLVVKLLYYPDMKTIAGVAFIKDDAQYEAYARKEVILSAGVINTPQILMLSGIGPKEELDKHNIEIVADLPVGKNLRDHLTTTLQLKTNLTALSTSFDQHVKDYLNETGLLTSPSNLKALALIQLENDEIPSTEYVLMAPNALRELPPVSYVSYKDNFRDALRYNVNPLQVFTLVISYFHPYSSGSVTLKSSNYLDFPLIDSSVMSNPRDVDKMFKSIKFGLKLVETEPFKEINATLLAPLFRQCIDFELLSTGYWHCVIAHLSFVSLHGTGTTQMGIDETNSVVDWQLKVHGIKNLRIADCGVIPITISGHTNAPAFMIGEKLADMIKDEYGEIVKGTNTEME